MHQSQPTNSSHPLNRRRAPPSNGSVNLLTHRPAKTRYSGRSSKCKTNHTTSVVTHLAKYNYLAIFIIILLETTVQRIHCLPSSKLPPFQFGPQATNQQYLRKSPPTAAATTPAPTATTTTSSSTYSSANNQLNSVNEQQPIAQSLPLVSSSRQSQQADQDNVIESTTSFLALQNVKGSSVSQTNCQLPLTWAGKWYQSNKEPIRVTNTEISDKGLCRDQKGDKYLFELGNTKQQQPCLLCLVINERHLNVLQYKESSCQPIPANYYNRSSNNLNIDDDHSLLDSICSDITGDAQLESLFRLDTPAIECPINGQYSFTYDSCREPQSSLDSCIDKKQLNFKFSACPDVPGSESKCKFQLYLIPATCVVCIHSNCVPSQNYMNHGTTKLRKVEHGEAVYDSSVTDTKLPCADPSSCCNTRNTIKVLGSLFCSPARG